MIVFPNCKINLGLNILRKRSDGFHDLETVFYPLPFYDAIEIIEMRDENEKTIFSTSGLATEIKTEENLCIKAWQLLKKDFAQLPEIKMHLLKNIPLGAGLGGGSSDGAFTLKLVNKKFDLGLSTEKLLDHALQLGSDCSFFIINKPCFAGGRGEFLQMISPDLSSYKFILVNPGTHINTSQAFSKITPALPKKSIKQIIQQPVETWKEELKNDFEETVFDLHPGIKKIKNDLYNAGAVYSSMTGSGSTVFGIFNKDIKPGFSFPSNYFVKELNSQL